MALKIKAILSYHKQFFTLRKVIQLTFRPCCETKYNGSI